MNYPQTLDYLYSKLPMFHRIGAAALKPDLTNTIKLCKALGNPETKFRSIHVAGTNGKGSVSHLLASIMQEAGFKTGLYTSPHLIDFRERIKINGEMISQDAVSGFIKKQKTLIEKIKPSFFEVTVAMAFEYFAENEVEIAIIETGLGGRLDSTNVIKPILSVITNISYDHQYLLGNTLAEIASEKAGIIKSRVPVVIGKSDPETNPVFSHKVKEMHTVLFHADANIICKNPHLENGILKAEFVNKRSDSVYHILSPLSGQYQLENITTVLQSVEVLNNNGFSLNKEQIKTGINRVKENTGLMGRWEIIGKNPLIVCDVAHNEAGLEIVFDQAKTIPHKKTRIVYGMVKDKDTNKALLQLPKNAVYYFTQPDLPRALEANELYKLAKAEGLKGTSYTTVKEAYNKAISESAKDDMILVVGSIFVVAEVLAIV